MKTAFFYFVAVFILALGASAQSITGIINVYTPVLEINTTTCRPLIIVQDSKGFTPGDKVLIIQMQGASVNLTNTSEYGKIIDYSTCGNHEFARISGITNNTIYLQRQLLHGYTISGKVQLVRVPEYENVTITDSIICPPWDGKVGGIITLDVKNTLTLNGIISADGKGFRGGKPINSSSLPSYHVADYKGPVSKPGFYAHKGEGIGGELDGELLGKGAPANGGGGGNNHNAGGGGGANGGCGGVGGYGWQSSLYSGNYIQAQGLGGKELGYIPGKIFLGGGGGAGHTNQNDPSYGGNGGGIILIRSERIIGNTKKITSHGFGAPNSLRDAAGGGGSGGTIVLLTNIFENLTVTANGGKGGDNTWPSDQTIAPGGGGGGGTLFFRQAALPNGVSTQVQEGISGVVLHSSNKLGSTNGCVGKINFNAVISENSSSGQPIPSASGVLYSPVTEVSTDRTKITVGVGADDFCPDNKLLIIQMRGAEVQSVPGSSYGSVTSYNDAGNYEFCRISSVSGNVLTLSKPLTRPYNPAGKVQVVRVPEFRNYTLSDTLYCPQWNDTVYGVVALAVVDTLHLVAPIIASGSGFAGGRAVNAKATDSTHLDVYFGAEDSSRYALKGQGIASYLPPEHRAGRGALAIAGGGGNNHNAGGGGGANGGCGGKGGFGWDEMKSGNNQLSQGLGGYSADNTNNKIFMGGGGGAGHSNELTGTSGGNGGGIVIIDARYISAEGGTIFANGTTAGNAPYDGGGGGGAGGTVLLKISAILGQLTIEAQGGNGGKVAIHRDGPGGGGGGGVVCFSLPMTPAGATVVNSGGYAGTSRSFEEYGQSDGCTGIVRTTIEIPGDNSILSVNHSRAENASSPLVYPQPARDIMTLQPPSGSPLATRCSLFDLLGHHVGEGTLTDSGTWTIDVSTLISGVYVATIYTSTGAIPVRVLVKP